MCRSYGVEGLKSKCHSRNTVGFSFYKRKLVEYFITFLKSHSFEYGNPYEVFEIVWVEALSRINIEERSFGDLSVTVQIIYYMVLLLPEIALLSPTPG